MLFDGVRVFVQNGKLDDVDVAYFVNKVKESSKGKDLQRLSLVLGDDYVDMRYRFKNYPFERIWRLSASECDRTAAALMQ